MIKELTERLTVLKLQSSAVCFDLNKNKLFARMLGLIPSSANNLLSKKSDYFPEVAVANPKTGGNVAYFLAVKSKLFARILGLIPRSANKLLSKKVTISTKYASVILKARGKSRLFFVIKSKKFPKAHFGIP